MSLKISIGGEQKRVDKDYIEIDRWAKEYLRIIKSTKEYLIYGKRIGWSVANQLSYSINWTPEMDKNLSEKDIEEIKELIKNGNKKKYEELIEKSDKDELIKKFMDEIIQKAKIYLEVHESRKAYLKYGYSLGYTVAHYLAKTGQWYPEMDRNLTKKDIKEILKWKSAKTFPSGASVAHLIAMNEKENEKDAWSTKDIDILTLEDSSKGMVAFTLIKWMWKNIIYRKCYSTQPHCYYLPPWMKDESGKPDMKILSLKNSGGKTVAYEYAWIHGKYWLCDDIEILKLDDGKGTTVAHVLAEKNWGWPTEKLKNSPAFKDILKWRDSSGGTVAHRLAFYFNGRNKSEPLRGWKTDDPDILSIADNNGNTVAHILADCCKYINWKTNDRKILNLKNNEGITVEQKLKRKIVYNCKLPS